MAAFIFVATNAQQMRLCESYSYFFIYERRGGGGEGEGLKRAAISPVSVSGFANTYINANIWTFGSTFMDL